MLVRFNPAISNNRSQSTRFKSLKDGKIVAEEVVKYTQAKLLTGIIDAGGYRPTADNFSKNLSELDKARQIASKDKNVGASIIDYLDEAKEALIEQAKKLGIS
jgi:hypothetical protein